MVDGELCPTLDAGGVQRLLDDDEATGGMRPKLGAALEAIAAGVPRVHLVDGRLPHALLLEILTDRGVGTLVVGDGDPILAEATPDGEAPMDEAPEEETSAEEAP